MEVAAAQILRADFLAGRSFHQRWAVEKDRSLLADDDALDAHRRDVGAASGATPHHAGDLGNALRRHLRLVEENAAEVIAVGKDVSLVRQIGAAAVDEIDAWQAVLLDAVAGEELAARYVTFAALLTSAERRLGDVGSQLVDQCAIVRGASAEFLAVVRDPRLDARRAHALLPSVDRNAAA